MSHWSAPHPHACSARACTASTVVLLDGFEYSLRLANRQQTTIVIEETDASSKADTILAWHAAVSTCSNAENKILCWVHVGCST